MNKTELFDIDTFGHQEPFADFNEYSDDFKRKRYDSIEGELAMTSSIYRSF